MADRLLLEGGVDAVLLENGTDRLLLENAILRRMALDGVAAQAFTTSTAGAGDTPVTSLLGSPTVEVSGGRASRIQFPATPGVGATASQVVWDLGVDYQQVALSSVQTHAARPPAVHGICSASTQTGATTFLVRFNGVGQLVLRKDAFTTVATTTWAIPVEGGTYRYLVTNNAGTATLSIFDEYGTTPLDTVSGAVGVDNGQVTFGSPTAVVSDPQFFLDDLIVLDRAVDPGPPPAAPNVTATQANDTANIAGAPRVVGTVTATQVGNTASAVGTPRAAGTVTATQAGDTASAVGTPRATGTVATSQVGNTANIAGAPRVAGTVTTTQTAQTAAASGAPRVVGTGTATQAGDTASAGTTGTTGTVPAQQADNTAAAVGHSKVTGTVAAIQADNTANITAAGTVNLPGVVTVAWPTVTVEPSFTGTVDITWPTVTVEAGLAGTVTVDWPTVTVEHLSEVAP